MCIDIVLSDRVWHYVHVRKDVYEVQMQGMNIKLDMILEHVKESQEERKAIRNDISELTRVVSILSKLHFCCRNLCYFCYCN